MRPELAVSDVSTLASPTSPNDTAATATRRVAAEAHDHKLNLNFKAGKIEASNRYHAPSAGQHRAETHTIGRRICVAPPHRIQMPRIILCVTRRYEHLSNYITIATSLNHEAHHKAAQARQALTEIPHTILGALTTPNALPC